jgi:hypothetical protein
MWGLGGKRIGPGVLVGEEIWRWEEDERGKKVRRNWSFMTESFCERKT